ncbi:uncharacterized protein LOC111321200 isoform X1 [Stylophora pistillata]|uniref:uncharacterized protein LOC111321200 isoform X1 n=1 Tax=Stylophora pistillata TaxID=50429 RepID=UPI000C0548AC|nr:uncharacterized protein LOC111321200 isoform X1 [Stylophora pistillata]
MGFKRIIILVFFQFVIHLSALALADGGCSTNCSEYFLTQENRRLMGFVMQRFESQSLLSCSLSCLQQSWCTSINFKLISLDGKGICELNKSDFDSDTGSKLYAVPGITFSKLLKDSADKGATGKPTRPKENITLRFQCEGLMDLFADGLPIGRHNNADPRSPTKFVISGNTRVLSVISRSQIRRGGILGSLSNGLITNSSWKCMDDPYPGCKWMTPDFDDRMWPAAKEIVFHRPRPTKVPGIAQGAKWIWIAKGPGPVQAHPPRHVTVYCRLKMP